MFSHSSFYAHDKYNNDVVITNVNWVLVGFLTCSFFGFEVFFVDASKTLKEQGVVQRFRV